MADRYRGTRRRHGMMLRASTMGKSRPWASLPAEIRLMILETIAQQRHVGWASLASVCKEWQSVIAKENFRQIKLRPTCLTDFQSLIVRQRHLIRYIQLEIQLSKYTCWDCKKNASQRSIKQDGLSISRGISRLLRILGTWESTRERHTANNGLPNGITLELNAYSPSDTEHWFRNLHFTSAADADANNDDNCKLDDPEHGWLGGQQLISPPATAIPRLFSELQPGFRQSLPRVGNITRLIIRRRVRRTILPRALLSLFRKLNAVEHLVWEPWRQWENRSREMHDHFFLSFVYDLPKTLKKISFFEDFSDSLATVLVKARSPAITPVRKQVAAVRVVDPQIGAAFASISRDLEQLSVAYMANADDFFGACLPSWSWPRLESLALTSQLLYHDLGRRVLIGDLLYKAGITALRMPKLRTLAIWNGREGNACAFIYHTDSDYAYVTWRGTWEMDLSPRVVEVWERVAAESRSCPLRVRKQQVWGAIGSHGDAIHHLALPCPVIDSESLRHIRREEK